MTFCTSFLCPEKTWVVCNLYCKPLCNAQCNVKSVAQACHSLSGSSCEECCEKMLPSGMGSDFCALGCKGGIKAVNRRLGLMARIAFFALSCQPAVVGGAETPIRQDVDAKTATSIRRANARFVRLVDGGRLRDATQMISPAFTWSDTDGGIQNRKSYLDVLRIQVEAGRPRTHTISIAATRREGTDVVARTVDYQDWQRHGRTPSTNVPFVRITYTARWRVVKNVAQLVGLVIEKRESRRPSGREVIATRRSR